MWKRAEGACGQSVPLNTLIYRPYLTTWCPRQLPFGPTMTERLLSDSFSEQGRWPANLTTQATSALENQHVMATAALSQSRWVRFKLNAPFDSQSLLRSRPKEGETGSQPIVRPKHLPSEETAGAVICRQCRHEITASTESRMINGAHAHTFANPEGIVFEIVCYRDAWGCGYVGPASSEFTWFSGYLWRIAVCANCHAHLGWRFSGPDGHHFHGLIANRIVARQS